nr:hypothetical protein Itr_chr11CG13290 [Ipomoea trifida]
MRCLPEFGEGFISYECKTSDPRLHCYFSDDIHGYREVKLWRLSVFLVDDFQGDSSLEKLETTFWEVQSPKKMGLRPEKK